MKSKYQAIHFDMDGVIADTEPFHVAAEQQTCVEYDFAIEPSQWGGFKGRTSKDIFTHLINTYGDPQVHTPEQLIERKTDIFLESVSGRLTPIDGVLGFLHWAREAHEYMSLVTSSNSRVQRFIVSTFEIEGLFDVVVTGDDITEGKPSPQPYQKAIDMLGAKASKSVVIEDSHSGIISGRTAGCDVLAIMTSHSHAELTEARPTYIVPNYDEAQRQLELVGR